MVSPEFFVSRVTFPMGATAIVLIFGGLTFFFGKLIDEILVREQENKDRQVLGALFIFNKIFLPFLLVALYFNQNILPVVQPGTVFSVVGVTLTGGIFKAQSWLGKMDKFNLHRTERFENSLNSRFERFMPKKIVELYNQHWDVTPLEFIQADLELSAEFMMSKKVTFIGKIVFAYFLTSTFLSGNILAIAFAAVFALSGYSLLAKSWGYMNSSYSWTIVETRSGERFEGRILSDGDKVTLWSEENQKIEINSDEVAVKRQSAWKDEKMEADVE